MKRSEDVALGVDDDPGAQVLGVGRALVLGLDEDEPSPDGGVYLGAHRGLRLQLRDRRAHLLVHDAVDVLGADAGPARRPQIGDREDNERGQGNQHHADLQQSPRSPRATGPGW